MLCKCFKSNWHLAAICQLPIQLYSIGSKILKNRIGSWLPVASYRFIRTHELAASYLLPVAYSPVILCKCFKSNRHLAASCQLPNSLEFANRHLAAVCRLPVQLKCSKILINRIGSWLPVASCRFVRTHELAASYLLPVLYSPVMLCKCFKSNWHLAASCQLPIH